MWTLTIRVTFAHPFRLPQGLCLSPHPPTTRLTPQFLSLSPSPPSFPSSSLTASCLLFSGPCRGDGIGLGVTHQAIKTRWTPGLGKVQTSTPGPTATSPPPQPLQPAGGGLRKKQLEISRMCKGGGKELAPQHTPPQQLSTAKPSAQHRAPRGRVRWGPHKTWAWKMHSTVPKGSGGSVGHILHPLLGLFPEQEDAKEDPAHLHPRAQ